MSFKLAKDKKEEILAKFDYIIDCFASFEVENESYCSDSHRYVIFKLEEAKINCENNKYFSIKDAIVEFDKVANFSELCGLCFALKELDNSIDIAMDEYRNTYCKVKRLFNNYLTVNDFCRSIKEYPDLCEEFTSYIFNGEEFEGELIEIGGHTAESLMDAFENVAKCYEQMMLFRDTLKKPACYV